MHTQTCAGQIFKYSVEAIKILRLCSCKNYVHCILNQNEIVHFVLSPLDSSVCRNLSVCESVRPPPIANMNTLPDLRTRDAVHSYLHRLVLQLGTDLADPWVAHELDHKDKLVGFREKFHVPKISEVLEVDKWAKGQWRYLTYVY